MYQVKVKSGTNGYSDYDNCDMLIAEIPSNSIPNVGDTLTFGDKENRNWKSYLVRGVERSFNHKNDKHEFQEWISIYVINI